MQNFTYGLQIWQNYGCKSPIATSLLTNSSSCLILYDTNLLRLVIIIHHMFAYACLSEAVHYAEYYAACKWIGSFNWWIHMNCML